MTLPCPLRRSRLTAATLSLSALVFALPCLAAPKDPDAPAPTPSVLPVRAVTLFSSGVSYTLCEGEVGGNATIPLTFRTAQINDILKSLVLLDPQGTVQPAIYAAKDPIGRALQSFAVDVTNPASRTDLLNKLRGAKVIVETSGAKPQTISGQIVGVEEKETPLGSSDRTTSVAILTVLGEAGLQSVRLDDVSSIRLLDERLNREFREALSLLSSGSDDRRRQVVLRFDGTGRRMVRVGYITESPLWKISYRLLLGGETGTTGKPYLQGWAMVENTTDEDWNGVRLSLVSGRPISFIQDLYQPLYLPRPVVPPDVIAVPFPQLAEGSLENEDRPAPAAGVGGRAGDDVFKSRATQGPALGGTRALSRNALARQNGTPSAVDSITSEAPPPPQGMAAFQYDSVAARAAGEKAGELFAYNITTPVTLPRQQAAMIPVIAQAIDGEKVSLYNADSGPRFPLNAVRIRNDTKLHLKGGPVTLFDGSTYAGDARM
ncbi:MAG: hypothetical protein H7Z41_02100, partial [Cytophagales bacterium]|nr:hypothetical protein [Armatimonadota bacterium]